MAQSMNPRGFVEPPWLETVDGQSCTVVVKANVWCAHPEIGYDTHRRSFDTLAEGVAYLARLGFALPGMTTSSACPVDVLAV